jgi:hypothetical protein
MAVTYASAADLATALRSAAAAHGRQYMVDQQDGSPGPAGPGAGT